MNLIAALLLAASAAAAAPLPSVDERVSAIISNMTLDEKIGQLQQAGGPVEGSKELVNLARQGKIAYFEAFGQRDPQAKTPMTRVYTLVAAPVVVGPKPSVSVKPPCGKFLKKCE